MGIKAAGGLGQVAHRQGVDRKGPVGVGLAAVHRGVGRAVDHRIGPHRPHCAEHLIAPGDVQVPTAGGNHLVA